MIATCAGCGAPYRSSMGRVDVYACNSTYDGVVWDRHANCYTRELIEIMRQTLWQCGCGHYNGANLAVCAVCGRKPAGS
jgi:hypothetical protein